MPINLFQPLESCIHEVQASIGICKEKVQVHCAYETSVGLPVIYKVMYDGVDILGCLTGEVVDALEAHADQVLETLLKEEDAKTAE
jgi:hypothetical protein